MSCKLRIIVTAGPTVEHIDPVRFISNSSTGKMGYEIAGALVRKGARVCLVSGPSCRSIPENMEFVRIASSGEMLEEIRKRQHEYDCLIMAAAVCDFAPECPQKEKIKKKERMNISFIKTKDILAELKGNKRLTKVGFALESENAEKNAIKKLKEKGLDLIVLNKILSDNSPFGDSETDYSLIYGDEKISNTGALKKSEAAKLIARESLKLCEKKISQGMFSEEKRT